MKGGAVAADGRIEPGDMLLQVYDTTTHYKWALGSFSRKYYKLKVYFVFFMSYFFWFYFYGPLRESKCAQMSSEQIALWLL
jgi:hypothetical protein